MSRVHSEIDDYIIEELEKIKAEIEVEIEDCIPAYGHDAWWNGKKYGFEEALAILDKHIKEEQ